MVALAGAGENGVEVAQYKSSPSSHVKAEVVAAAEWLKPYWHAAPLDGNSFTNVPPS
jgi:hypothetical protein